MAETAQRWQALSCLSLLVAGKSGGMGRLARGS